MPEVSNAFVVVLGISIVFIGLICIIILCKILGAICNISENRNNAAAPAAPIVSAPAATQPIENRQEIIAAISAALAEEVGTDVSAIRILSFKKI